MNRQWVAYFASAPEAKRVAAYLNSHGWECWYSAGSAPTLRATKPAATLVGFTKALVDCAAVYSCGAL